MFLFLIMPVLGFGQDVGTEGTTVPPQGEWVGLAIGIAGLAIGIVGILIAVGIFIFHIQQSKKQKTIEDKRFKEQMDKTEDLKEQLAKREDTVIEQKSFVLIGNFTAYEYEIRRLVETAKQSIRLCLVTPLLHSFRETWGIYNEETTPEWAKIFCEPFIESLRKKKEGGTTLIVEFLYLENNLMRQMAWHVPAVSVPWDEYHQSIEYFFSCLNDVCKLNRHQIQEAPLYFAIVDYELATLCSDTNQAEGIVAFINCHDLIKQAMDKKINDLSFSQNRAADEIAGNLQCFKFRNPLILDFFMRLLNDLSLYRPLGELYKFFKMFAFHGYEYGMITSPELRHIYKQPEHQDDLGEFEDLASELKNVCQSHNLINDTKFYLKKSKNKE